MMCHNLLMAFKQPNSHMVNHHGENKVGGGGLVNTFQATHYRLAEAGTPFFFFF